MSLKVWLLLKLMFVEGEVVVEVVEVDVGVVDVVEVDVGVVVVVDVVEGVVVVEGRSRCRSACCC